MEFPGIIYGYIYITVNNINGKRYLGQKKLDDCGRWKTYIGSGIAFKHAVVKYGKENFTRHIIDFANSQEELNRLENEYTIKLNCVNDRNYYNLVHGGGTVSGLKFSKETLKKLSDRMIGERNYFYGKRYYGETNGFYGKTHSLESRKKMSEGHKGQISWSKGKTGVFSDEALQKMREAKLGKPLSQSHKEAIAKAQSGENHPMYGKQHSDETKQLIREKALGRKATDETKRKMSEAQRKRAGNPSYKIDHFKRPVRCVTTDIVFESLKDACDYYDLKSSSSISEVCKGNRKTAGKLNNGTRLEWEYTKQVNTEVTI